MAEYGITDKGFEIKRLDEILEELHSELSGKFGFNTRLDPQSFLNVLITTYGGQISELWEVAQASYYAKYPSTAEGVSLDNAVQYGGIRRSPNKYSYYTLHCTGDDGTIVRQGATVATNTAPQAKLAAVSEFVITRESFNKVSIRVSAPITGAIYSVSINGVQYSFTSVSDDELSIIEGLSKAVNPDGYKVSVNESNITLDVISESASRSGILVLSDNLTTASVTTLADFATIDYGKLIFPNGTITIMITNISGFNAVENLIAPTYGRLQETDVELRHSYLAKSAIRSTRMILHIGDDYLSDYKSAIKSGINSYKIYSCEDLFYGTNFMPDVGPDMELDSKIKIGLFISNIFNNPFVFERLEKDICIQNNKTIGYSFCAPLIMDFVKWFEEKTRECNDCQIWLSARDGYLIKKIYEILYPNRKTHYVLTSRTAAIRAGTLSEDDIAYVDDMKFGGNMDLCLKKRFGIDVNKIDIKQIDDTQQGILKYKEIIIGEAWKKYLNYKKYLKKICEKNKNILFFDFVAKGTCQFFIKKMVPNKIKGLYFLQLEPQYMNDKQIQIESFFTEREKIKSTIYQDYYILETILTSFSPSVNEFNISGEPIYAEETRLKEDLDCIYEVQSGILNYIKDFIKIYPIEQLKINKKLDEQILSAIHNVNLNDCYFSKLKVEDPFFNRMTDIKQVL